MVLLVPGWTHVVPATPPAGARTLTGDLKTKFSLMIIPKEENLTEEQTLDAFRAALRDLEELDSDNDRHSNIEEIRARTFPGDPGDHSATNQQ